MNVTPYIFFDRQCNDAINFYKKAIGAEVLFMMQYKDAPEAMPEPMNSPDMQNCVLHATLKIGDSEVMLSDAPPGNHKGHAGFSLSITVADKNTADEMFNALAEGGNVQMPLEPTFFSPYFGTLADKFGVEWMVYAESNEENTK